MPGRKEIEDHQTGRSVAGGPTSCKAGLGVLAAAYRDRLVREVTGRAAGGAGPDGGAGSELSAAVGFVEGVCVEMVRNPNESLMLEALLVRLSAPSAGTRRATWPKPSGSLVRPSPG